MLRVVQKQFGLAGDHLNAHASFENSSDCLARTLLEIYERSIQTTYFFINKIQKFRIMR